jgi:hypothetical protein
MLAIFVLLVLPLITTAFAAGYRSVRLNYGLTLFAGITHLAASLYCLVTRINPFPSGLVAGGRSARRVLSHHPLTHVRARGALLAGLPAADAGSGI